METGHPRKVPGLGALILGFEGVGAEFNLL
jgi:hypothetical protein